MVMKTIAEGYRKVLNADPMVWMIWTSMMLGLMVFGLTFIGIFGADYWTTVWWIVPVKVLMLAVLVWLESVFFKAVVRIYSD